MGNVFEETRSKLGGDVGSLVSFNAIGRTSTEGDEDNEYASRRPQRKVQRKWLQSRYIASTIDRHGTQVQREDISERAVSMVAVVRSGLHACANAAKNLFLTMFHFCTTSILYKRSCFMLRNDPIGARLALVMDFYKKDSKVRKI